MRQVEGCAEEGEADNNSDSDCAKFLGGRPGSG